MKQINLEQRSDQWRQWRREGVTASDAAVLVNQGCNSLSHKTRWQLWAEKTGVMDEPDLSSNPHVQRGVKEEDDARNLMEQALGDAPLLPVCGEWERNSRLRASFDGLTREGIPVELKAPVKRYTRRSRRRRINPKAIAVLTHRCSFSYWLLTHLVAGSVSIAKACRCCLY